jgi:hypothetical protein
VQPYPGDRSIAELLYASSCRHLKRCKHGRQTGGDNPQQRHSTSVSAPPPTVDAFNHPSPSADGGFAGEPDFPASQAATSPCGIARPAPESTGTNSNQATCTARHQTASSTERLRPISGLLYYPASGRSEAPTLPFPTTLRAPARSLPLLDHSLDIQPLPRKHTLRPQRIRRRCLRHPAPQVFKTTTFSLRTHNRDPFAAPLLSSHQQEIVLLLRPRRLPAAPVQGRQ